MLRKLGNLKPTRETIKNVALMAPVIVGTLAVNAFAEGGATTTLPTLNASALDPIITAFNQYAGVIFPVGIGFIAVKKGIGFIPKLINMFFK